MCSTAYVHKTSLAVCLHSSIHRINHSSGQWLRKPVKLTPEKNLRYFHRMSQAASVNWKELWERDGRQVVENAIVRPALSNLPCIQREIHARIWETQVNCSEIENKASGIRIGQLQFSTRQPHLGSLIEEEYLVWNNGIANFFYYTDLGTTIYILPLILIIIMKRPLFK